MKKLLIGTTALVAAGIIAAPAMAADPITLKLSGSMSHWAGNVDNDETFESRAGTGVSSRAFDVKSDSEIHFSGSTKLDNGLSVSVKIELEADQQSSDGDSIDHSFMRIASPTMGAIIMGSVGGSNGVPDASYGTEDADASDWYTLPAGLTHQGEATSRTDRTRIDYTSPSFGGFSVGLGILPELNNDLGTGVGSKLAAAGGASTAGALAYYYKAKYTGKFSGVGLNVGYQYVNIDRNETSLTSANNSADWYENRAQASVSFAGFTLGGAVRDYNTDSSTSEFEGGLAYNVGIGYVTGPYEFTLTRYHSKMGGDSTVVGDDEITNTSIGIAYNMGGGVRVNAGYTDFDLTEENQTAAGKNNGSILAVGVSAAF